MAAVRLLAQSTPKNVRFRPVKTPGCIYWVPEVISLHGLSLLFVQNKIISYYPLPLARRHDQHFQTTTPPGFCQVTFPRHEEGSLRSRVSSSGSVRSWAPAPQPRCANLTLGVQSSTAARAGRRGPQEAGAPRGARSYAEQPEGPEARPGRGLQQLPERRGGDGGAEARGSGAQGAGHAAQQGKHRGEDTCRGKDDRAKTPDDLAHRRKPRPRPGSSFTSEGGRHRARLRPLPGAASAAGEAPNPVAVFSALLPTLPNSPFSQPTPGFVTSWNTLRSHLNSRRTFTPRSPHL